MSNEQAYKDAITIIASDSITPSDYREMVMELARETPEVFLSLAESHGRYKTRTIGNEGEITEDDKELFRLIQENDSLVPAIQRRREQMKVKGGEGLKESKDYVMALREKYPDYSSIAKVLGAEAKKYTLGELLKERLKSRPSYEGEGEF